jgi:four helix bundle protein
MSRGIRYHTDLDVWQGSKRLALSAYRIALHFPDSEKYALADQVKRSAASVPANIAEGCGRGTSRELIRYLRVARGSLSELHSHLALAADLGYVPLAARTIFDEISRIHGMLNAFIGSLMRTMR